MDRPIICITAPRLRQKKKHFLVPRNPKERWLDFQYVLNRIELELENTVFLGDAVPFYMPDLGPDSFTAFLGADLTFKSDRTSWVKSFREDLLDYMSVLNEDNKWWKIMNQLMDEICKVAEGNFLVGIPDIHYGGDPLVATIGAQKLTRYLLTKPKEIKRLIVKLNEICPTVFDHYYRNFARTERYNNLDTRIF